MCILRKHNNYSWERISIYFGRGIHDSCTLSIMISSVRKQLNLFSWSLKAFLNYLTYVWKNNLPLKLILRLCRRLTPIQRWRKVWKSGKIGRHNLPSRPPGWDKVNCSAKIWGVVPPCPRFRHPCYLPTFHQEKGVVSAFTGRLSVHNLNKSWDIPRDHYWHNKMWLRESTFSTHSSSQLQSKLL